MTSIDPRTYQAIALRKGIQLYQRTGIKPNRLWTPKAMLDTAGRITGQTFKRGQYSQAIEALTCFLGTDKD